MSRRLERSSTDRVIAGVCGGIAEYLAVDATLVRVFFVVATVLTAFLFLLVYIALLLLMPLPGQRAPIDGLIPGATSAAASPDATGDASAPRPPAYVNGGEADRRRSAIGYVLVALGLVFLLGNLGAFRFIQWQLAWPIVLIALGVLLLVQRARP